MKKTSIFTLLLIALGFMTKAQTVTTYPAQIWDGMDSITIHYNPFGTTGNNWDTVFQTFTGPLYAYIYQSDSGSGIVSGPYQNNSWGGVVAPAYQFTEVSATDWVLTIPSTRQGFINQASPAAAMGPDVYVTGLNVIVKAAGAGGGDSQANSQYIPVTHAGMSTPLISGQPITTGPNTLVPGTLLASSTENVVIYYHPQQDTNHYVGSSADGDSIFHSYHGTIYAWCWVLYAPLGTTINLTSSWTSVGATSSDSLVQIDSNNYAFDIRNLVGDFMAQGLPSGSTIDTIGVLFRDSTPTMQTVNFYVPLVITTNTVSAVANVNANTISASVYPNPATDAIFVSYAFAQPTSGNTTLNIYNMLGQVVMTQDMGKNQASNMYLSVASLPSGIYNIIVSNGNEQKVLRLSKQ